MKDLFKILILSAGILLNSSIVASAQGYCPTPDEYINGISSYADSAKNFALNGGTSVQINELEANYEKRKINIYNGCLAYFKTNKTPNCKKLKVLYASYSGLEESKQTRLRPQIQALLPTVDVSCPADARVLRMLMNY